MPPVSRILEVAVYSLLNFLPFLALALYPFRNSLRFSAKVTGCLIGLLTVIQLMLGVWAAFFPGETWGESVLSARYCMRCSIFWRSESIGGKRCLPC